MFHIDFIFCYKILLFKNENKAHFISNMYGNVTQNFKVLQKILKLMLQYLLHGLKKKKYMLLRNGDVLC